MAPLRILHHLLNIHMMQVSLLLQMIISIPIIIRIASLGQIVRVGPLEVQAPWRMLILWHSARCKVLGRSRKCRWWSTKAPARTLFKIKCVCLGIHFVLTRKRLFLSVIYPFWAETVQNSYHCVWYCRFSYSLSSKIPSVCREIALGQRQVFLIAFLFCIKVFVVAKA